jgi:serine/threonine-protein kinase HipA
VDSKHVLWKNFRLAMSFGTKPHYTMRQVAPRHFLQSATKAGVGKDVVPSIIEELHNTALAAIDRIGADLPSGFPQKLAESISNGIRRRLMILESGQKA